MRQQRGFTLVELLVTLGLAGVIITIVMSFFIMNIKSYETINTETEVQYQSQSAINFITNKILESREFKGKDGIIYKFEHNNGDIFGFGFEEDDEVIKYYEDINDISKSADIGKYVEKFEIKDGANNSQVVIELKLYKNKKKPDDTYDASQTVYMRNSK